jgi:hypothetical protein
MTNLGTGFLDVTAIVQPNTACTAVRPTGAMCRSCLELCEARWYIVLKDHFQVQLVSMVLWHPVREPLPPSTKIHQS